jgi:hypothetical protein
LGRKKRRRDKIRRGEEGMGTGETKGKEDWEMGEYSI